jgi:proteasome beta subunit
MEDDTKKYILKTGTTTVGIVTKEGIVLAADKQGSYAGEGGVAYIAGKTEKIHEFNNNIMITIAGGASMALRAIQSAKAQIRIKELKEKRKSTIKEIANLFSIIAMQALQGGGIISFIIAGKENEKTHIYEITPDGMVKEKEDYVIVGSGMTHVNAILDTEYKGDLSLKEGLALAKRCIIGSSGRDPATGIGYEIWTITPEKVEKVEDKTWKIE